MCKRNLILIVSIFTIIFIHSTKSAHIKGSFKSNEFFKFLVKFGFQKTDRHQRESTDGYIFGNITSKQKLPVSVTLAVLPRSYFLQYYQNRGIYNKKEACKHMFSKLKVSAYDKKCATKGNDYLRKIPCPKNKLCIDEDTPWNVIKGHQFTFVIQDLRQPS